jgi:hypothetical protein
METVGALLLLDGVVTATLLKVAVALAAVLWLETARPT